jgi:hypothetical protein
MAGPDSVVTIHCRDIEHAKGRAMAFLALEPLSPRPGNGQPLPLPARRKRTPWGWLDLAGILAGFVGALALIYALGL